MTPEAATANTEYDWRRDVLNAAGFALALALALLLGVVSPLALVLALCFEPVFTGLRHLAMTGLAIRAGRGPLLDGASQGFFFLLHYGVFCGAALLTAIVNIAALMSGAPAGPSSEGIVLDAALFRHISLRIDDSLAFLIVAAWQVFQLRQFIARGDVARLTNARLLGEPYVRLFFQAAPAVFLGAALLEIKAPPSAFLIPLLYKTAFDAVIIAWIGRAQWAPWARLRK